jgi:transcriptional regulator with XRE-family HTH domain
MDLNSESFILAKTLATPNRMTLVSDNIRYLRKLNGLTQEQFSRKINIKRSLLGAYEEGRANPNQQNIQAIAKAFNTTVELLTRQDLRKIRETPSLSIPLGQKGDDPYASRSTNEHAATVRSDGKLTTDDDPFQHPDFPDIFARPGFAQPAAPTPEPQPLASVLNKYYKPSEASPGGANPSGEPRREYVAPPVITAPVRPGSQSNSPGERPQPAAYQSRPADSRAPERNTAPPVDRLFSSQPEPRPTPASRPTETLTFNNVYEGTSASAHPASTTQPVMPSFPVVMQRQFAEYGQRYRQDDFLRRLPAMHLPTLPEDHYRAFEAGDDFAFPGALLVGKFVRNWFDVADGKLYVLLIQQQPTGAGIRCRRVYNQVKVKGSLLLTTDRVDLPNLDVALNDVLEVWEVCAFVSQQLPPSPPNTDRLRQLVDELKFEVERI